MLNNKTKTIIALLIIFLTPCKAVNADTIRLKGIAGNINGKIVELTQEYIGITISEKDIKSVTIQPGGQQTYPDRVSFPTSGVEVKCKVTRMSTGSIGIRIPRPEVVSLHMVFTPSSTPGGRGMSEEAAPPSTDSPHMGWAGVEEEEPKRQPRTPQVNRETAKEQIKQDLLDELAEEEEASRETAWTSPQAFKEEIKKELKDELDAKREAEEKSFQETNLGRVEGRILRKGLPLAYCEVRIIMLVKSKIPFSNSFYQTDMPSEYDGITDDEGRYHLVNVAPGAYKIYWKPPTESGWIRRLDMKPDIIVESGKTTYPKDIETFKRIIN